MMNRSRKHQRKKGSSSTSKVGTIIATLLLSSPQFQKGSSASAATQQDSSYDQIQNSSSYSSVVVLDDDGGDDGHDIGQRRTEEESIGSKLSSELEVVSKFENRATPTGTAASIYQSPSPSSEEEEKEKEIDGSAFNEKYPTSDTQIQPIATAEDDTDEEKDTDDGENKRKRTKSKKRRRKKVRPSDNDIHRIPTSDPSCTSTRSSKRKRISVRFTPGVFQTRQQVERPPPETLIKSSSSQQNDNSSRHDGRPRAKASNSLMYYVPIILERSFLLFGLAAIAVLKFDHSSVSTTAGSAVKSMHMPPNPSSDGAAVATTATKTQTTTSFLGLIRGNRMGNFLAKFLGSISFEWKTLWIKTNDVLPSLASALLIVWVPQLISSRAWWDLGTMLGMPVLLSITSSAPSSSLYSLSLWIQQKLFPSMIKMIHKVIWTEVWKLTWDYVFRPLPTHPENKEGENGHVNVSYGNNDLGTFPTTVETHQPSSSTSSFVSWVEHWNNRAVNASTYLWHRVHSKMSRMAQTLLQRPFEQQMKLSIIGMLIPDDSKPTPPVARGSSGSSSDRTRSSSVLSSSSHRSGGGKPTNVPLRP